MVAEWVANAPSIPEQNRDALRQTVVSVVSAQLSEAFGGEQLRLYVPKINAEQRRSQKERIAAALIAGETSTVIAKREKVHPGWVRRLRGRIGK
jgi:hypothetical protein